MKVIIRQFGFMQTIYILIEWYVDQFYLCIHLTQDLEFLAQ
jgi:hypothetical protein